MSTVNPLSNPQQIFNPDLSGLLKGLDRSANSDLTGTVMESNLPTRHVFIVGGASLFEEGLTNLLTFGTSLQVSGAKYVDDAWFLDTIARNQPDVILLTESTFFDSTHLLGLLFSIPTSALLYVIIVRLADNMADVHQISKRNGARRACKHQQFMLTKPDDLVAIVQGDFSHIQNRERAPFYLCRCIWN